MTDRTCSVAGCEQPVRVKSRGWCNTHYQRWMKHGDVGPAEQFRSRGEGCSIEGCNGAYMARGWCQMHYKRWKNNGDPHIAQRLAKGQKSPLLQVAARSTSADCIFLPWKYKGRPKAELNGQQMLASRAVWIIANGDPGDRSVLHTCNGGSGDSGCINIQHLYLGDHRQNYVDAERSGRTKARLTYAQATEIRSRRAEGESVAAMAREFGVSDSCVRDVIHGRTYRPGAAR